MRIVVTLAFLLLCCTTISVSQNCINQDVRLKSETQQQNVRPQFPGGNKALVDFLSKNINYPESAKQNKISGRVVVMFQVDVDGTISNVSIAQSLTPECDKEAKRVVRPTRWVCGRMPSAPRFWLLLSTSGSVSPT